MLFQNTTCGISLKISSDMKPEMILMNISHSVTLKSFSLSWHLSGSLPMHDFVTLLIGNVEYSHRFIQTLQVLADSIMQYLKITFINIATKLISNICIY